MGLLGAAGGRFGLDFGFIWGSILGSQARSAILVKNSTAPRREHDFEGSGDCQKGPKMGPKTASDGSPAQKPSWGPLGPHFGPFWGPLGEPKWSPKPFPKQEPNLSYFRGLPWGAQAVKPYPPGVQTGWFLSPGGDYRGGYLTRVYTICGQIYKRLEV